MRDLHLSETELLPPYTKHLPVVNDSSKLTVEAPWELKRDINVTVAGHVSSSFRNKPNLDIINIHPNWVIVKKMHNL